MGDTLEPSSIGMSISCADTHTHIAFWLIPVGFVAVESSYDGPRIDEESNQIDKKFVDSMIERFKNQKTVHRKYAFMVHKGKGKASHDEI